MGVGVSVGSREAVALWRCGAASRAAAVTVAKLQLVPIVAIGRKEGSMATARELIFWRRFDVTGMSSSCYSFLLLMS